MAEVDLDLPGAVFLDDRVDGETRIVRELVDRVDDRAVVVHRRHGVGLPARAAAAGPPHRRLDRLVRVGVGLDEVELELGRNHGCPAALGIELDDVLQYLARSDADRHAVLAVEVVDDLQRRLLRPGHGFRRRHVGPQHEVALGPLVGDIHLDVRARYRLVENRHRQVDDMVRAELLGRHGLTARHAREVRDDALHLVDVETAAVRLERLGQFVEPIVFMLVDVRHPAVKPPKSYSNNPATVTLIVGDDHVVEQPPHRHGHGLRPAEPDHEIRPAAGHAEPVGECRPRSPGSPPRSPA